MAAEKKWTCYDGQCVQNFQFYLEHSGEHQAIVQSLNSLLPGEFKRMGAGSTGLDVLGVGSGGGQVDVQLLSLLQSMFPDVPITADIVEGSDELTQNFKALLAKTTSLEKIKFTWHNTNSETYEKQVKEKGEAKRFDFIHMIQMMYYVDNLEETVKFYHSQLKKNGRLMIIIETANGGWDTLWSTFHKELCGDAIKEYCSSRSVIAILKELGLKYEEHLVHNAFDITECFDLGSAYGERLLDFMTISQHFHQSFTPETRAAMLDLLRNKCSTEKDGKVLFNSRLSCIFVQA